ncbi:MAG: adenosylcobinamide-phosphate synthase CbiB [Sulfurimonas sp.]|nr:adenosylcobinamide-phosphate synthase CbiB [Sulfurimonas sp.]
MTNILVAVFAYIIDRIFGEFKFIKHPVIIIGGLINFFENKFYKNSVLQGFLLVLFVLGIVTFLSIVISTFLNFLPLFLNIIITSLFASIFIAHKMLYDSVKNILYVDDKKTAISMLVSRDTQNMSESDIYKAAIETYAENLSDGVIAPIFYLILFGLPGIIIYKTINTMDSMVGYRNTRYERYGKVAAILDDVANFIPSRLTAVFIMMVSSKKNVFAFYAHGKKHESPNAGHPITAMALAIDVKLGGDTYYFGKLKKKPCFGYGKKDITKGDLENALRILV